MKTLVQVVQVVAAPILLFGFLVSLLLWKSFGDFIDSLPPRLVLSILLLLLLGVMSGNSHRNEGWG